MHQNASFVHSLRWEWAPATAKRNKSAPSKPRQGHEEMTSQDRSQIYCEFEKKIPWWERRHRHSTQGIADSKKDTMISAALRSRGRDENEFRRAVSFWLHSVAVQTSHERTFYCSAVFERTCFLPSAGDGFACVLQGHRSLSLAPQQKMKDVAIVQYKPFCLFDPDD